MGFLMKGALLLALFPMLGSAAWAHEGHHEMAGALGTTESLYAKPSAWVTQEGEAVDLGSLRGQPVVATMLYTSCTEVCPLIVEKMKRIEAALDATSHGPVRFAVFSFDTVRDNPARLTAFAAAHGLDLKIWTLFQGKARAVRALAADLGVRYKRDMNGDFDHTTAIVLLDEKGKIVARLDGLEENSAGFETELKRQAK